MSKYFIEVELVRSEDLSSAVNVRVSVDGKTWEGMDSLSLAYKKAGATQVVRDTATEVLEYRGLERTEDLSFYPTGEALLLLASGTK